VSDPESKGSDWTYVWLWDWVKVIVLLLLMAVVTLVIFSSVAGQHWALPIVYQPFTGLH
jgi:hypothetical protein